MQLKGNTILITGGTSGIGLALAEEFFNRGNKIIICGRREYRLAEIKKKYPDMVTMECDVSNAEDRVELANWAFENYPSINIIINNAGIQLPVDLTHPIQLHTVREEIETNLVAPIHLASLFAGQLKKQNNSAIINITSGLAFTPIAFMPVYCASKAAMHSVSLSLRQQLKQTSVRVIEIIPPSVDTELGHQRRSDKTQSHGGIPVSEFIAEAIVALEQDEEEIAVGSAKNLRDKRELLFDMINSQALA